MKKLIFVTGAGRGIGRSIALHLCNEGFAVSGCARSLAELKETQSLSNGKIKITSVDVTQEEAVESWISRECGQAGVQPYGLVTAAGVHGEIGPFVKTNFEDWKKSIEVNLYGSLIPIQIFTRFLTEKDLPGRIVLLSGGGATQPISNLSAYCAAKAAVVRVAETIAQELKAYDITVNCIAPGAVNTAITQTILDAGPEKAGHGLYEKTLKQSRMGGQSPKHAAHLTAYLMGEGAKAITGKLISAVWDPWENLHEHAHLLNSSDVYALRRILPEDRAGAANLAILAKEVNRT